MKIQAIIYLILIFCFSCSPEYVKDSEKIIYSFESVDGKKLVVVTDTISDYLACRFGTEGEFEFEYPDDKKDSWVQFQYSYYMRGGGPGNAGMDLNFLYFGDDDYNYIVFDEYAAENDTSICGIRIINLKTKETVEIIGDIKTKLGTLIDFRFDDRIEIIEE